MNLMYDVAAPRDIADLLQRVGVIRYVSKSDSNIEIKKIEQPTIRIIGYS